MSARISEPVWPGFDDEQRSMREVLRESLEQVADPAEREQVPTTLGMGGLLLAEEDGGLGLGPVELLLVSEELGAQLADATYLATNVLGAGLLRDLPGEPAAELRRAVAEGSVRLAVADLNAEPLPWSGTTVTGDVAWVLGDDGCDQVLVRTDAGLVAVAVGQAGVELTSVRTLDAHRSISRLRLDGAAATLLAAPDPTAVAVDHALALAELAVTGSAVGGARWALDAAVSYARTRTQFDQPIGSFQAVKHLCAEMLVGLESAKALAVNAAMLMSEPDRPGTTQRDLDAAFLCATEEYVAIAKAATHVHGGIGVTWEFGLHRYLKRALTLDSLVEPVQRVRHRVRTALREGAMAG